MHHQQTRPMTVAERTQLETLLADLPIPPAKWWRIMQYALRSWLAILLALIVVAALVIWPIVALADLDWSAYQSRLISTLLLLWLFSGLYAIHAAIKKVKTEPDLRANMMSDLAQQVVIEERLTLVAARRYQEFEHHSLLYFLLTDDQRVLIWYDHESYHLTLQQQDPFSSSFQPTTQFIVARAPLSDCVLAQHNRGERLPITTCYALALPPQDWPIHASWCSLDWSELARHFGDESIQHDSQSH